MYFLFFSQRPANPKFPMVIVALGAEIDTSNLMWAILRRRRRNERVRESHWRPIALNPRAIRYQRRLVTEVLPKLLPGLVEAFKLELGQGLSLERL